MAAQTIVRGDDLMLFDASGHSYAFATSHSLSVNGETSNVATKDNGKWSASQVNKLSWELSSENLFATEEFDKLMTAMLGRSEMVVYFALKQDSELDKDGLSPQGNGTYVADYWTATSTKPLYKGKVVITSLSANAATGENASYSVTFTGVGSLSKVESVGD